MLIYALIYWSIILLAGIIFTFKIFEELLNLVIKICRKWIITRLLIVVPLRLTINILTSAGIGIIVFFHVFFFVFIVVFIYVFTIWDGGDTRKVSSMLAYICLFSLFAPMAFSIIKTIYDEIQEYRNSKDN
jgi:hypothetical protein